MKQNYRRDLVLNSLAGLTNAAEAIVLSIITVRIGRLSDAGVLSLAFAAGNVLLTIALFGGKLFQASDVKHVFSFRTYLYQRLITILCMSAVLGGILFFAGYSREKAMAVLLIALIYMIEAVEDCFWGRLQLEGKLYLGAVMFISRWWCIMLTYLAAVSYSRDMVTALIAACIAGFVIFLGWCIYFAGAGRKMLTNEDADEKREGLPALFIQTLPLFFVSFASMMLSNIAKFAIDRNMSDEVQACYGFVAMPVFVISLLSQFIYQPDVVKMSKWWNEGEHALFGKGMKKQLTVIAGLTVLCTGGAALIGIPVLSLVFSTDLSGYRRELVVLQLSGSMLAFSSYFGLILTIMRRQKFILPGYGIALITGVLIIPAAVASWGTVGAAAGYLAVMAVLSVYFIIVLAAMRRNDAEIRP